MPNSIHLEEVGGKKKKRVKFALFSHDEWRMEIKHHTFGDFSTSTRHILQLPATESRS